MPFLRSLIFLSVSTSLSIPSPPLLSSNLVQLHIELSRHTSVRPLTHIHPFIHPPIHPSIYPSSHPPNHSSIYSFKHSFIHSNNLSTHPYILHSLQDNKQNNKQQKTTDKLGLREIKPRQRPPAYKTTYGTLNHARNSPKLPT